MWRRRPIAVQMVSHGHCPWCGRWCSRDPCGGYRWVRVGLNVEVNADGDDAREEQGKEDVADHGDTVPPCGLGAVGEWVPHYRVIGRGVPALGGEVVIVEGSDVGVPTYREIARRVTTPLPH